MARFFFRCRRRCFFSVPPNANDGWGTSSSSQRPARAIINDRWPSSFGYASTLEGEIRFVLPFVSFFLSRLRRRRRRSFLFYFYRCTARISAILRRVTRHSSAAPSSRRGGKKTNKTKQMNIKKSRIYIESSSASIGRVLPSLYRVIFFYGIGLWNRFLWFGKRVNKKKVVNPMKPGKKR